MRGYLGIIIAVPVIVVTNLSARSDEIPILNVQPICRGITGEGDAQLQAGDRSVTMDECLNAEKIDRESIKKEWSEFSADDKRHCTAEATMGGESSYTELLTCLEMARDVRLLKSPSSSSPGTTTKRAH